MPDHEHAKRQFFEYLQGMPDPPFPCWYFAYVWFVLITTVPVGEAESGLERLHQCAEKELQIYLNADGPSKDFNEFRTKLAGLTRFVLIEYHFIFCILIATT